LTFGFCAACRIGMKAKRLFLALAVTLMIPFFETFADPPVTFEVLATFDYPGFTSTVAYKINDEAYVAGSMYNGDTHTLQGYLRSPAGRLSQPIVDPNGSPSFTNVYGLNNQRQMCGSYSGGHNRGDGFLLSHHNFITADFPGATYSDNLGLNNAGNFCGGYSTGANYAAFVNIDGTYISFEVPGTWYTGAQAINNLNQSVGYYYDTSSVAHGFLRDADGAASHSLARTGTLGFGPGTFSVVFPFFAGAIGDPTQIVWLFLHNDYLQTIMEWGWLGSLLWGTVFFGGTIVATRGLLNSGRYWLPRQRLLLSLVLVSLVGVGTHAAVDFPLQISSIQLYVAVYLGTCWGSEGWGGRRKD